MSVPAFFECISEPAERQNVIDDARSGQQAGVMMLPTIFVFDNATQRWWRAKNGEQSIRQLHQWRKAGMLRFPSLSCSALPFGVRLDNTAKKGHVMGKQQSISTQPVKGMRDVYPKEMFFPELAFCALACRIKILWIC